MKCVCLHMQCVRVESPAISNTISVECSHLHETQSANVQSAVRYVCFHVCVGC